MNNNTAHLYLFDLKTAQCKPFPLLSTEQKNDATYQLSRYLIRYCLADQNIPLDQFHYQGKKPCLQGKTSISLSHSDDIFVIALMNTSAIGADIQIQPLQNPTAFIKRYGLGRLDEQALLTHWTIVEAYCKATQQSLFQSLHPSIYNKIQEQGLSHWHTKTPYPIAIVAKDLIHEVITHF